MALPRKLKNFNVYYNGDNWIGLCSEVELPKLTRKTEEYRAGGMPGPVDVDLGLEKIEMTHTYGGFMREIYRQFGIPLVSGVMLRFAGAYQRDDTAAVDAVEILVRGRHTEIDPGSAKAGDDTEFKVTTAVAYLLILVNNAPEIEIDLENFREYSGGIDRLAEQRNAMGL
jgi:P2 family phage contractile tail tube protein